MKYFMSNIFISYIWDNWYCCRFKTFTSLSKLSSDELILILSKRTNIQPVYISVFSWLLPNRWHTRSFIFMESSDIIYSYMAHWKQMQCFRIKHWVGSITPACLAADDGLASAPAQWLYVRRAASPHQVAFLHRCMLDICSLSSIKLLLKI